MNGQQYFSSAEKAPNENEPHEFAATELEYTVALLAFELLLTIACSLAYQKLYRFDYVGFAHQCPKQIIKSIFDNRFSFSN